MTSHPGRTISIALTAVLATVAMLAAVAASSAGALTPRTDPDTAFVASIYQIILGRPADQAGEAYWVAKLTNGASMASVADQMSSSSEANSVLVTEAFVDYLSRPVDPTGLATYTGLLDSGSPAAYVVERLTSSAEAYQTAGGTAAGFVTYLYRVLLDRAPSGADLTYWDGRLPDPTQSYQRKALTIAIAGSSEATNLAVGQAATRACGDDVTVSTTEAFALGYGYAASGHDFLRLAANARANICPLSS